MLRKPPELEFVSMFATGECRWLNTGFPGQPGRPLVVMGSEMRLCRSLTASHAWKPPEARIQYRANALPSKLARQGSAAQFLLSFHSIVQCSWPRQLFLGWHCNSGSQSDTESGCKWERDTRRAKFWFFPALTGEYSGTVADSPIPRSFLVTKRLARPCSTR